MPRDDSRPIDNDGPRILGVVLAITIFALITMVARLFVRVKLIRNVGWDDYCMSFAMLLCITGACIVIPQVRLGAGRHVGNIPPKDFQIAFKLNFVTQPIYLIAICVVKLSVGFFLLRIAILPLYRRAIQGIMAFMGFYTLGCFFTVMFQCTNLAVQWDPSVKGTCWSASTIRGLSYTNVACNIITDLLFAVVIPIPMLWQLQMNRRQKTSIIGVLGLGIFATAAAIVKLSFLPYYGREGDWLWDSRNITIWTVLECCVGIIAGNLPCLKPLFRTVLGSTYGRGSRAKTAGTGTSTTPASRYLSRAYAAGTHAHTVKSRGFNSLNSSNTKADHRQDPDEYDEYMMMPINGGAKGVSRSASAGSARGAGSEDARSEKGSEGSVELLEKRPGMKLGGILRTTEVQTSVEEVVAPPPPMSLGRGRGGGVQEGLRPVRGVRDLV
ncbi:hypothetical protein BU23DRAFT_458233 [Bimuria novae-zelandiae CBS 107.79]|uniref:Rhodopsin domain-containing protein n=1 Tax=Bimuria novae-zelandiae CBS 107.79 TaxID=1447943 RepID=A0A6A5VE64_9PLEO|nr:hypothetical protein BU23DRAFT_458233 [Bimuria novae-zelandiae CBS 107.79]